MVCGRAPHYAPALWLRVMSCNPNKPSLRLIQCNRVCPSAGLTDHDGTDGSVDTARRGGIGRKLQQFGGGSKRPHRRCTPAGTGGTALCREACRPGEGGEGGSEHSGHIGDGGDGGGWKMPGRKGQLGQDPAKKRSIGGISGQFR